jgi:hypothetical protein
MNFDIFAKKCRALIPEGITLLEHDGALPFHDGEKVALFGRGQYEYLKSGSGSGGSVPCAYVTKIIDELKTRVAVELAIAAASIIAAICVWFTGAGVKNSTYIFYAFVIVAVVFLARYARACGKRVAVTLL